MRAEPLQPPPANGYQGAPQLTDIHGRVPPTSASNASGLPGKLDLPPEVSLAEAARIANCDKKTVIRYLQDGLLEWRDIAPPSSSRPTYRIKLASILALRTGYRHGRTNAGHVREKAGNDFGKRDSRGTDRHQFKHVRFGSR